MCDIIALGGSPCLEVLLIDKLGTFSVFLVPTGGRPGATPFLFKHRASENVCKSWAENADIGTGQR